MSSAAIFGTGATGVETNGRSGGQGRIAWDPNTIRRSRRLRRYGSHHAQTNWLLETVTTQALTPRVSDLLDRQSAVPDAVSVAKAAPFGAIVAWIADLKV